LKTVLVTGARGFIGRRLVAKLRAQPEYRVWALGRAGDDELHVSLEALTPQFWRDRRIDAIETVVHLGAFTPKNQEQADDARSIVTGNIDGTLALLESLPGTPRHIVFASAIDVYERAPGRVIDESSPVVPATLYGASKVLGEALVRSFARRTGCRYTVLRIGHIYGPGEERYEKVIPSLIRAMLQGAVPTLSGDGSVLRDFLYVDDAVEAIAAAARTGGTDEIINVVRGESISIREVAQRIAAVAGYRGEFCYTGPNAVSLRFDNARMRQLLHVQNFMPLDEGLAREIAAFQL
jgi:nucleoside-diphosphate-sugar epimerase